MTLTRIGASSTASVRASVSMAALMALPQEKPGVARLPAAPEKKVIEPAPPICGTARRATPYGPQN